MFTTLPTMEHDYQLRNGIIVDDAKHSLQVPVKITASSIKIGCARISVEAAQFIMQKHKENFEAPKEITV